MTTPFSSWRTCPACARREAGLIDPECIVCAGDGRLELGPLALHRRTPQVVARAVEMNLEATARLALSGRDPDLDAARRDVHLQVARLRTGNLLARHRAPRLPPGPAGGWVSDPDDHGAADEGFRAAGYLTRLVDPATLDLPDPDVDEDQADDEPAPERADPPSVAHRRGLDRRRRPRRR